MKISSSFVTLLSDLAVVHVDGDDAASFLHTQLTNDVSGLASDEARLAGYCTPKGRLLATMVVWRAARGDSPDLRFILKAGIADALAKRLSMFVLRAKAKLQVSKHPVLGVALLAGGDTQVDKAFDGAACPAISRILNEASCLPAGLQPWTVLRDGMGTWIAAPSAGAAISRWWLLPHKPIESLDIDDAHSGHWRVQDIDAGLPWVETATQDVFIPQTLNLDLIAGVSFSKGCYPGQEVVARSHYRGTVKRRMALAQVAVSADMDATTLAGIDTYDARKPDNPCGRIVNAAAGADGVLHVLMEVQLSDLDNADFRLGEPDGPAMRLLDLPYPIRA